jgi:Mg-chelatase subunit ChlD
MPDSNRTHITLILDRSGSMASIKSDVIAGVNNFINEQKKVPGRCTLTVVQFDDKDPYEVLIDKKDIADATVLTDYQPRGWTPLYDAVGRGIVMTGDWLRSLRDNERPEKVVFVIMTDGAENHSKGASR